MPEAWDAVAQSEDGDMKSRFARIKKAISWKSTKTGLPDPAKAGEGIDPLTEEEKKLHTIGKNLYVQTCVPCHLFSGRGQPGLAPPLENSEWVGGSDKRLVRILLGGLRGPIKVNDEEWDLEMPAWGGALDDQTIAGLLTYVRQRFAEAKPVSAETVEAIRTITEKRKDPWTAAELLKIKD